MDEQKKKSLEEQMEEQEEKTVNELVEEQEWKPQEEQVEEFEGWEERESRRIVSYKYPLFESNSFSMIKIRQNQNLPL